VLVDVISIGGGALQFPFLESLKIMCPEEHKPCHLTLVGAALLTCWLYVAAFPHVFLGESFGAALGKVFAGDVLGGEGFWLALLVSGIIALFIGLRAALSHDDPLNRDSLIGTIILGAVCLLALRGEWYLTGSAFSWHASRAAWLSLMAFCAANIWLETRRVFARRVSNVPAPVPQYEPQPVLVVTHWTELPSYAADRLAALPDASGQDNVVPLLPRQRRRLLPRR
jgi:hypothetical protein